MTKYLLLLVIAFSLFLPQQTIAAEQKLPTVTIINPIRGHQLGLENADLLKSLEGQWQITKETKLPATWLWQYSALEENDLTNFAKSEMKDQEFGVFLEVDKNTAERSGVQYKGQGPWYHSDGLLLVSYDQAERRKIIDTVFEKFKSEFGYYPKSVGAWWVGSDAISYMQKKYGVISVLQCTDQFNTDAYSLWGTPWSIPYIPSKTNAAISAQTPGDTANNVVILQWATRDPMRAYGDSVEDSTFSIQDYGMKLYDISYHEYLSNIFLKEPFDQTVIGLEGGLPPDSYKIQYKKQLEKTKEWQDKGKIQVQTAGNYGKDFLARGEALPPTKYFLTKDFKTDDQSFWYNTSHYRTGIQKQKDVISVIDFRDYTKTSAEDFSLIPNTQPIIRINTHSIIDSVRFPDQKLVLAKSNEPLAIKKEGSLIILLSGKKELARFNDSEVSLNTESKSNPMVYHFSNNVPINYQLLFIIFTLLLYVIYLYFKSKTRKNFIARLILLTVLVLIVYPVISNSMNFEDTYYFDGRFLSLLFYTSFFPVPPEVKLFITYQLLPIIGILGIHYLLSKYITKASLLISISAIGFISVMFVSSDLFPLYLSLFTEGKKKFLLGIILFVIAAFICGLLVYLFRKQRQRLVIAVLAITCLLLLIGNRQLFLSPKMDVITHFEMEALNQMYAEKKDVLLITNPPVTNIELYKSFKPFIFTNDKQGGWLTNTVWHTKQRMYDEQIVMDKQHTLYVIPAYQNAYIYASEVKKAKLKKTFDNAQIQLYEKQ